MSNDKLRIISNYIEFILRHFIIPDPDPRSSPQFALYILELKHFGASITTGPQCTIFEQVVGVIIGIPPDLYYIY